MYGTARFRQCAAALHPLRPDASRDRLPCDAGEQDALRRWSNLMGTDPFASMTNRPRLGEDLGTASRVDTAAIFLPSGDHVRPPIHRQESAPRPTLLEIDDGMVGTAMRRDHVDDAAGEICDRAPGGRYESAYEPWAMATG